MTWEAVYLICFIVGFLLSLIAFLGQGLHFGHWHGHAHIDAAGHGAHGHGAPGHGPIGGVVPKLNSMTITAFLAWFGGTGYLLEKYTSIWVWLAFGCATAAGLVGASAVFSVLRKLTRRDYTMNPADYDMIGKLGRVSAPVNSAGVGEMVFARDGARGSIPIRSEDGSGIGKDVEVVITRLEKGVAYVRRFEELTGDVKA
jgi:membrane protein implicated in regulation of membrane protease activity